MAKPPSLIPLQRINRILVVKPSSIGDVVHTLPTIAALRKGFPHAYLAWMVEEEGAGIVVGNPHLDEVIISQRKRWTRWLLHGPDRGPALHEAWEFLADLRAKQIDLVIDLQGLLKSGIPTWLSGAPYRLGFHRAREMSHLFLTHSVLVDHRSMHAVERYLEIPRSLGFPVEEKEFYLPVGEKEVASAAQLLREEGAGGPGAKIVLHAPARWESKRWPGEHFVELGDLLASRLGAQIILTGGRGDRHWLEGIASAMHTRPLVAAGRVNLKELCALLQQVELMITCDSGPMHIAAAIGLPTIALFGPTDPVRTGPYGRGHRVLQRQMDCIPCFRRHCSDNRCLKEIPAAEVFSVAEEVLKATGTH